MSDPVAPGTVTDFVTRAFVSLGVPAPDAERVAGLADGIALHPALRAELDRVAQDLAIAPL